MRSGATFSHSRSLGSGGATMVSTGGRTRRATVAAPGRLSHDPRGAASTVQGMSRSTRLGIVLAAVVVLVVAWVVLGQSNDDSPSSPAADVVTTGTAAAPAANPEASAVPSTTATAEPAAPAEPTIAVRGGQVPGDPKALKFSGGERVRFRVTSDEPIEVHVHGYDLEEAAAPGAPAEFSFAPELQGAYDIELHPSEVQIGTLEVAP
jgi:plastocyanin